MHRSRVIVAFLLMLAACSGEPDAPQRPAEEAPAAQPAEGAMCDEHGVLEAVCTKCNPALIPVFRSRGDFCEEHGFAESFCPICHPERGGRPENAVGDDTDGPADGTRVRFRTRETSRLAGLRFAQAESRPTARELSVTARVVYDATRVAEINARFPGVVRTLRVDIGTRVRPRAPLAVIESADVGAVQSDMRSAQSRLEAAEANLARVEGLRTDGISTERDLLAARTERDDARADVGAARASLGMVGASASGRAQYTLTSPIEGVVTARRATIGHLVTSDDVIFEIVDPSQVWVELDVPESDLPLVAEGQSVKITFDSLPGVERTGTLAYVAPAVDPRTRTAVARVALENTDGALRANLFGRARIAVTDPRASVLVPRAAVQRARGVNVVFVRTAEDTFEARRVVVQPGGEASLAVTGRVAQGDTVVTEGSFLLRTEILKESIGAGCCEVD